MDLVLAVIFPSFPASVGYGTLLHGGVCLAVYLHVLSKPRDSRTALLWIFLVTALPFIGVVAYVIFGINTIPSKGWEKQFSDTIFRKSQHRRTLSAHPLAMMHAQRDSFRLHADITDHGALNRILDNLMRNHPLMDGNSIVLMERAAEALQAIFDAVASARHHVHVASYILQDDIVGKQLMDLLAERARAGVQVRVLYDAFGSAGASFRLFFWRYRNIPNLRAAGFSQANIFKRKFQINLRNHRKIVVVDGEQAFTGGINFHDVYLPREGHGGGVVDFHYALRGPVVLDLQYTFLRDWYYITDESAETLHSVSLFPIPSRAGEIAARVQNSGPTPDENGVTLDTIIAALNLARSQALILTPYFVPPESLMLALRQAAFRGVEIKVVVPAVNNHPTLKLASQALYKPLLMAGIRIFERRAPFIHAKAMVLDDSVAIIGSANLDPRSLFLNYESNVVIFNPDFAALQKAAILHELSHSDEVLYSDWRRRPWFRQLLENFFNLFHPIA